MPSGLYTRWEWNEDKQKFKLRQKKTRKFENMVISYYQKVNTSCQIQSFYTGSSQELNVLLLMVFALIAIQSLKEGDVTSTFVPVQKPAQH